MGIGALSEDAEEPPRYAKAMDSALETSGERLRDHLA